MDILGFDIKGKVYKKNDDIKPIAEYFWGFQEFFAEFFKQNGYTEIFPTYMSIGEILELPAEELTEWEKANVITYLGKHVSEIETYKKNYQDRENRLERKRHKLARFGGRRIWELSSIYFDAYPVMITQQAGREGDDHVKEFIIDGEEYDNMVSYIQKQIQIQDKEDSGTSSTKGLGMDYRAKALTHFYGYNIHNVEDLE